MDIYSIHAADLQSLQTEQGATCPVLTWNGVDWLVLPGGAVLRKNLSTGVLQMQADARFTLVFAQFSTVDPNQYPDAMTVKNLMLETECVYLGDSYKVTSVSIMGNGRQLHVEANASNLS